MPYIHSNYFTHNCEHDNVYNKFLIILSRVLNAFFISQSIDILQKYIRLHCLCIRHNLAEIIVILDCFIGNVFFPKILVLVGFITSIYIIQSYLLYSFI